MDRRKLLAVTIGAAGAAAAVGVVGISQAATSGDATAPAEDQPVQPAGGAGLFDVDPDQGDLSQDPNVAVTSDVSALPEDMEF